MHDVFRSIITDGKEIDEVIKECENETNFLIVLTSSVIHDGENEKSNYESRFISPAINDGASDNSVNK